MFDHPSVIKLIDIIKPDAKTGFEDIYIVFEYMETDLHRVIYSQQELTDDHIQYFIYQTLTAVLYLHVGRVMHRDIKPSNILLNKDCNLKLCDFGLARGFDSEVSVETKTEYVVTRWYRAPEVILNASEYGESIDMWSVGCVLAELLGKAPLFPGNDYLDQIKRIISVLGTPNKEEMLFIGSDSAKKYIKSLPKRNRQPFISLYPKSNPLALDLLTNLLVFNPNNRYTAKQALDHEYFDSVRAKENESQPKEPFDWSWDNFEPTKEILQNMVFELGSVFHPY
jgi:serine/threonine protein kinase